jgi:HK97 gp10 family phage protein
MAEVASSSVDISGFLADLAKLDRAMQGRALANAAKAGATVIEAAAKENIVFYDFIDTGATLNSVAPDAVDVSGDEVEIHVGPATEYAIYGELGTRYMTPRPFMREAVDMNHDAIAAAVGASLTDDIRRAL